MVLKPAVDGAETTWIAELLGGVEQAGFRVARPRRAQDGRWVVDGWSATHFVEGEPGPAGRWDDVLLVQGRPPAVIDFSPYWRPATYANAVVAIDGLLWHGAGPEVVALAASGPDFQQMLVRAAIFRLFANDPDELAPFPPVVAMLTERAPA